MEAVLTYFNPPFIVLLIIVVYLVAREIIKDINSGGRFLKGAVRDKKTKIQEEQNREEEYESYKQRVENIEKVLNKNTEMFIEKLSLLIESDKDDIKSFITEKHHYYCYQVGYIDDYTMDCIEKRYAHYVKEGGNSFVEDLMNDLRKLPKSNIVLKKD